MLNLLQSELNNHIQAAQAMHELFPQIISSYEMISSCLKNDGKILICGNGGSAADSQHFAAELTGRYKRERKALAAIALSTDTSALTAIGNDYGYDHVFSRQTLALARPGDILFGISTSGNSQNIILAMQKAKEVGCKTIALSGRDGGKMKEIADLNLIAPSKDTPRIQEMHIFIIHCLCEMIESTI